MLPSNHDALPQRVTLWGCVVEIVVIVVIVMVIVIAIVIVVVIVIVIVIGIWRRTPHLDGYSSSRSPFEQSTADPPWPGHA